MKGWFPGVCQGPLSPVPEGGTSQREALSEMFFHSDNTTLVKQRSCPRAKRRPALRCISQDSPEKQSQQEVCVERDLIKELTHVAAEASPEAKSEWMGHTRFLEGKLLYLASPPWNVCLVQRHLHRNMQTVFGQIPGCHGPTTLPHKINRHVGFSISMWLSKRMGPSPGCPGWGG